MADIDADFSGTPLSGDAPLNTQFTDLSTPSSAPAPYAYKWNFGDGTPPVIDTDSTPLHGYAAIGVYDVDLRTYWKDNGTLIGPIQLADSFSAAGLLVGASPDETDFLIPSVWRDNGDGNLLLKTGGKLTTTAPNDSAYARASIGVDTGGAPVDPLPYYMTGETIKCTVDVTFTGAPGSPQGLALVSMQHDTYDGLERAVITGQIINLSGISANMRMNLSTNLGGNVSFDFTGLGAGTYPLVLEFYKNEQRLTFQGHQVVLTDDFSVLPRTDINLVTVQLRRFASMANLSLMAMDDEEVKASYVTVSAAPPPPPPPPIGTFMNVLPISRLIRVSANLTPAGAQAQNLSNLLILGSSNVIDTVQRKRDYASLEEVAADFGTSAPEYLAALLWFEQVPQPTTLSIGRMTTTASSGGLRGAPRSAAQQAIAAWNAVTNGSFTYTKDGGAPANITGLNFSAAANLNAVAAIIQGALPGITVQWNSVYARFEFTSTTTGITSAVGFLTPVGSGTDISSMVGGRSTDSGSYVFTGQAAETPIEAVQSFEIAYGRQWYALVVIGAVNADHLQIAAFLEGTNTKHLYGVTTLEGGVLVSTDTTNIAYQLKQLAYKKTMVQYASANPYAVVSALARILTTDYRGQNTTITLMYKQEPGIVPENLSTNQMNAVQGFNCNVFALFDNDTAIILYGVTASGIFIDTVIGTDAMVLDIQSDLWNLLYTSTTKIPQTNQGAHLMVTTCENRLAQYVANGFLAPGIWNATGFGSLKTGDYVAKGFYVFAPNVDSQPQADRAARKAVPIQIAAKLAGAVHEISVGITVNQ